MLSVAYLLTEVPAEGRASLHTKNTKSLFVFSSAAGCYVQCFKICLPLRQSWLRLPPQQAAAPALPTVLSCLIFLFSPSSQCSFFPILNLFLLLFSAQLEMQPRVSSVHILNFDSHPVKVIFASLG